MLLKLDPLSPCLKKVGPTSLLLKSDTKVLMGDRMVAPAQWPGASLPKFPADIPVEILGTLVPGSDYNVFVRPTGRVVAAKECDGMKIGGFHFAPGGNATAQAGGNDVPQINEFSIWDLKWRPRCLDARGMTLVANKFWVDIYLLNNNPQVNGTSAFGKTIANGGIVGEDGPGAAVVVPTMFGGDGTAVYPKLDWFAASELAEAFGKRLPTWAEFSAAAFGVTEGTNSTRSEVTALDAPRTSKWGLIQATGQRSVYGSDLIHLGFSDVNEEFKSPMPTDLGRGSMYVVVMDRVHPPLFGGNSEEEPIPGGSRTCDYDNDLVGSYMHYGVRLVSDHLFMP